MASTIVVLEKRPRWMPELQRQFAEHDVRVRGCRSAADLGRMLDESPGSVLVLDLAAAPAACLQFLGRRVGQALQSPAIVVASRKMADLEWPVRELGAVEFVADAISGEDLARLCRRQWSVN